MSADYRDDLYKNYVSQFKGDQRKVFEQDQARTFAYFDDKWKPWLNDLPRDAKILEIGCGPGFFLQYLQTLGFTHLDGIDLSAEQIAVAKSAGINARVANVFEVLEQSPDGYDAILGFDFVEHFRKDELAKLGEGFRTALKQRGRILLQTPNGEGLFNGHIVYGDLTHSTIFNPGSIRQWLSGHGFGEFEFREQGPSRRDLRGKIRSLCWSMIRLGLNIISKCANGRTQRIWTDNMLVRCVKVDTKGSI
jgi:SAM-dependent methyltransferase